MSELQKQILSLPVAERLRLISFIISSISEKEVNSTIPIPDDWIVQALARNADYESGKTQGVSWEDVKKRVHGKG